MFLTFVSRSLRREPQGQRERPVEQNRLESTDDRLDVGDHLGVVERVGSIEPVRESCGAREESRSSERRKTFTKLFAKRRLPFERNGSKRERKARFNEFLGCVVRRRPDLGE